MILLDTYVIIKGDFAFKIFSSKFALPYLQKSSNPHILNISPPLNMNPRWFKDHVGK